MIFKGGSWVSLSLFHESQPTLYSNAIPHNKLLTKLSSCATLRYENPAPTPPLPPAVSPVYSATASPSAANFPLRTNPRAANPNHSHTYAPLSRKSCNSRTYAKQGGGGDWSLHSRQHQNHFGRVAQRDIVDLAERIELKSRIEPSSKLK